MSIVCTLLNVQTVLSLKWRLFLLPNYLFIHLYSRLSSVYISLSDNPRLSMKTKAPLPSIILIEKNFASIYERFLNI